MPSPAEILLAHLTFVQRIVRGIAYGQRLTDEEREDFESYVRLRLLDHDYRAVRGYDGRGELCGYLVVVIHRFFVDFRQETWGRWRTSVVAQRLGPTAVELDTLLHRDGMSFDDAAAILLARHGAVVTRDELAQLACELSAGRRARRLYLSPQGNARAWGHEAVDQSPSAEQTTICAETASRVRATLAAAFRRLPGRDRLLLQLHYGAGLPLLRIAASWGQPAHAIYHHLDELRKLLKRELVRAGIRRPAIVELLRLGDFEANVPAEGGPLTDYDEASEVAEGGLADYDEAAHE